MTGDEKANKMAGKRVEDLIMAVCRVCSESESGSLRK